MGKQGLLQRYPLRYRLLTLFAVFAGGFDLGAAEVVCGAAPLQDFEVMDWLGSLVEKSLVMMEQRGEETRYRMLETLREEELF